MLRNLAIALLLLAFRALTLIILYPNMIRPDLIRDCLAQMTDESFQSFAALGQYIPGLH